MRVFVGAVLDCFRASAVPARVLPCCGPWRGIDALFIPSLAIHGQAFAPAADAGWHRLGAIAQPNRPVM
jgi:hypothetical protein